LSDTAAILLSQLETLQLWKHSSHSQMSMNLITEKWQCTALALGYQVFSKSGTHYPNR